MTVTVTAGYNITGHASSSANRCEVVARCRTNGYSLLRNSIFGSKPVKIDFSKMHSKSGEIFYVTSSDLQEYSHLIFGENADLEYYVSDTLFFRFPYENYKKVPVYLVNQLEFAPQYTLAGSIGVEPDSVFVYGEPSYIENVDYAFTEPIKLSGLKDNTQGVVKLKKIRGVRNSEESVRYTVGVSRFVEFRMKVQINTENVPEDKALMVYPSTADVVLRCRYPEIRGILAEDISFYVDYNDFNSSRSGTCLVRTGSMPAAVLDYRIEPEIFECVLNDR